MKPKGLSFFNSKDHKDLAKLFTNLKSGCIRNCQTVKDCIGRPACKGFSTILFVLFSFAAFSQTQTIKLADGSYQQVKVEFKSEAEVVNHFKLVSTGVTYTDVKGNKYPVYTDKNSKVWYIKQNINGVYTKRAIKPVQ